MSDWSSDVCSSDLVKNGSKTRGRLSASMPRPLSLNSMPMRPSRGRVTRMLIWADRKSVVEGKSVSVRVDLGGCRNSKKRTEYSHDRSGLDEQTSYSEKMRTRSRHIDNNKRG